MANDNNTLDARQKDPIAYYPWLSTEHADTAQKVIREAILSHLGGDEENVAALATWILEDLAVAGLELRAAEVGGDA